jgi:hypothetical protein
MPRFAPTERGPFFLRPETGTAKVLSPLHSSLLNLYNLRTHYSRKPI